MLNELADVVTGSVIHNRIDIKSKTGGGADYFPRSGVFPVFHFNEQGIRILRTFKSPEKQIVEINNTFARQTAFRFFQICFI